MNKSVMIIGGGGHAKVIIDCIRAAGDKPVGILDDGITEGTEILGVPVLGKTAVWKKYEQYFFVIAIGNNDVRARIAENMKVNWYSAIHPRSVVSEYAVIGQGTVVMPGAVINASAQVGEHCIVNTCAVIEHDCRLGHFVHISPNAALGGSVQIAEKCHVGLGAAVRNNISVCGGCVVGTGAVVVKNIMEPGVYIGVPAKKRE